MSNFTASALILAALGLFFWYTNPLYRSVSGNVELEEKSVVELRASRAEYHEALAKAREIELAETGLLEKYNSISAEDRERILKLLPDHIDSVRFIIDVNTIAAKYAMTLQHIALAEEGAQSTGRRAIGPRTESHAAVSFRFSVSGSYDAFRSFLSDLESSLRVIDITQVAFAARDDGAYDYQIGVVTYRLE